MQTVLVSSAEIKSLWKYNGKVKAVPIFNKARILYMNVSKITPPPFRKLVLLALHHRELRNEQHL